MQDNEEQKDLMIKPSSKKPSDKQKPKRISKWDPKRKLYNTKLSNIHQDLNNIEYSIGNLSEFNKHQVVTFSNRNTLDKPIGDFSDIDESIEL